MANRLIYLDTETTGLQAGVHAILQIAYIIEIDGVVKKRGNFFINPKTYVKPRKVSPKALEVNGRTLEEFDDFTDAKTALNDFIKVLNRYIAVGEKLVPVAYNSSFDVRFIQDWFKDQGCLDYGKYFSYKDLDVFQLVKYLGYCGLFNTGSSQKLSSACKTIGLEFDAHDAVADIEATRDLHLYLVNRFIGDKDATPD